jgi:hypothetical protein
VLFVCARHGGSAGLSLRACRRRRPKGPARTPAAAVRAHDAYYSAPDCMRPTAVPGCGRARATVRAARGRTAHGSPRVLKANDRPSLLRAQLAHRVQQLPMRANIGTRPWSKIRPQPQAPRCFRAQRRGSFNAFTVAMAFDRFDRHRSPSRPVKPLPTACGQPLLRASSFSCTKPARFRPANGSQHASRQGNAGPSGGQPAQNWRS